MSVSNREELDQRATLDLREEKAFRSAACSHLSSSLFLNVVIFALPYRLCVCVCVSGSAGGERSLGGFRSPRPDRNPWRVR